MEKLEIRGEKIEIRVGASELQGKRKKKKKFPRTDKDELLAGMGQQQVHKLSKHPGEVWWYQRERTKLFH